jgi:hypothetical protein
MADYAAPCLDCGSLVSCYCFTPGRQIEDNYSEVLGACTALVTPKWGMTSEEALTYLEVTTHYGLRPTLIAEQDRENDRLQLVRDIRAH